MVILGCVQNKSPSEATANENAGSNQESRQPAHLFPPPCLPECSETSKAIPKALAICLRFHQPQTTLTLLTLHLG
jgi:hypothetical protein